MSDRPNNRQPEDQDNRSGWRAPKFPGGWRVPKQATAPGERHAWRAPTKAMPKPNRKVGRAHPAARSLRFAR